jgi:hypothetical protein
MFALPICKHVHIAFFVCSILSYLRCLEFCLSSRDLAVSLKDYNHIDDSKKWRGIKSLVMIFIAVGFPPVHLPYTCQHVETQVTNN